MDIVVDASVAFKWLVREDGSDKALRLLDRCDVIAPALLLAECRNAILTNVRRGKLSVEAAKQIELDLDALQIATVPTELFLSQAFVLGLRLSHPIYDCIYLAAAMATDRVLITADGNFLAKLQASVIGVDRVRMLEAIVTES